MPIITRGNTNTTHSSDGVPGRNGHHHKALQQIRFRGEVLMKPVLKVPREEHLKQTGTEDHLCVLGPYSE